MRTEFEFIDHIKKIHGLSRIGDDCAVLPKDAENDLVITVDMLVEGIDFRLDWADAESLGHKALAVSLSDIAAMGATPSWAMLSVGVTQKVWNSDFLEAFYRGWHQLAAKYGVQLVGGDVSKVPSDLVVDSIVAGEVAAGRAVLRSGAAPGDFIYVSGELGGAAAGLKLLEQGPRTVGDEADSLNRLIGLQLRPNPQIELGKFLSQDQIASAMIDVSDGLAADLGHICEASGVGAELHLIPYDPEITEYFSTTESEGFALYGGEDFELLFTVPPHKVSEIRGFDSIRIGTITDERSKIELFRDNTRTAIPIKGFQHFS